MAIIKFFYVLNKNNYIKNNLIISQLSTNLQSFIFIWITVFKFLVVCFSGFIASFFMMKRNVNIEYLWIIQSLFLLVCFRAFSRQAKNSDKILNSLVFLLGGLFNNVEKKKNQNLVAIYYSVSSVLYTVIFNLNFMVVFKSSLKQVNTISLFMTPIFLCILVYSSLTTDIFCNKKAEVPYYINLFSLFTGYLFVIYGIEKFDWGIFAFKSSFSNIALFGTMIYIVTITLLFLTNLSKRKAKRKRKNYFISGLFKNYFIENIEHSTWLVFISALLIKLLPVSIISKVLIVVIVTVYLLTPNISNFKILNYIKLLGNNNYFSKKYLTKVFKYTVPLLIVFLMLSGIYNLYYIVCSIVCFGMIILIKHYTFISIMSLGHSDSKKIDYTLFFNLLVIGILVICAINLR